MAPQAKHEPEMVCNNGCHVIDRDVLLAADCQTQQGSAPGMEQVTAQQYAAHLAANLRDLHERRRAKRDVAPPGERVWSEQDDGTRRPRGQPCCENTRVQRAVVMLVARHELREQCRTWHRHWRVEADVRGCFATLAWSHVRAFLPHRVSDGGRLRLLGTWLHAGVLEAGVLKHLDKGTPQGGVGSPPFATVCLHHVLDAWGVKDVQPRITGRSFLRRFADACIIGFELEADARRVMTVLPKRCSRCRLTMHPEKTGLVACKKPPYRERAAHSKGTFDFRGLTHSWATTCRGYWGSKRKTVGKRRRRLMKEIWTGCREHRHAPLKEQYRTCGVQLRGYYQYYGIRGHCKMLAVVFEHPERAWHYWLRRRSHKGHVTWQKFENSLRQQ